MAVYLQRNGVADAAVGCLSAYPHAICDERDDDPKGIRLPDAVEEFVALFDMGHYEALQDPDPLAVSH